MEHEGDGDNKYNRSTRDSRQRTGTGIGGIGNKRTSGDHPNNCIVEIDQNTEKSPGNMRRLAAT